MHPNQNQGDNKINKTKPACWLNYKKAKTLQYFGF